MIETETKTVTEPRIVESLISVKCDSCGISMQFPNQDGNWHEESYGILRVSVKFETGHGYPEGGQVKVQEFDCCPACWTNRIVPLFVNPPRVREVDW